MKFLVTGIDNNKVQRLCENCKALDLTRKIYRATTHDQPCARHLTDNNLPAWHRKVWILQMRTKHVRTNPQQELDVSILPPRHQIDLFGPQPELLRGGLGEETKEELEFESAKYFADWQTDGREIIRDGEGWDKETRALTKRIRIRWKGGSFQDKFIIFVPPQAWTSSGVNADLFLARYIASACDKKSLVKRWVDLRDTSHGSSYRTNHFSESFKHMILRTIKDAIEIVSALGQRYL
ncbi:hypothetical protein BDY21DRAFT_358539 [Lineolata rhizophorae]|uniref:Uncharacterized protein n=1 Tax=Lineolata rhizophorae TaxID=578093 RepID=A0A6A6NLP9_9PEZI|nr:hypothetical protein BDY21DRAFT_358539 [Lineolata rhizophorae]